MTNGLSCSVFCIIGGMKKGGYGKMKIGINTEDCVRVEDCIYFISRDYNVIFRLKIKTGEVYIVGSLPEEHMLECQLGAKIVYANGELIFAPMNAKKIWRYNINDKKWIGYEKKKVNGVETPRAMFQAVLYNNKIIFMGSNYPAIVILNLETNVIEYIEEPYKRYIELSKKENDCFFRTDSVQIGNELYWASCLSNEVFRFNMDTYEYEFIIVGKSDYKYSGIDYDGKFFWLSPRKNTPAVRWDGVNDFSAINLPFVRKENVATIGNVICKDESVIFASRFIEDSFVIKDKNNFSDVEAFRGQYWFNKKIDSDTFVSLTMGKDICIETNDGKYEYELCVDYNLITSYIAENMLNSKNDIEIPFKLGGYNEVNSVDLGVFLKLL